MPTGISDTLLTKEKNARLIEEFRGETAESLNFTDEFFDYVLCKESYHHFPQPMKALYETLGVARQAVIMIEPNDQTTVHGGVAVLSRMFKDIVKRTLGRPIDRHASETSGNYAYMISGREMEKVAPGAGLRVLAFRGINDYYPPGMEFEPSDPAKRLFRKISGKIARYDFLCRLRIRQPGLLAVVLFKQAPTAVLRSSHSRQGLDLIDLPRNPYLNAGAVR